eukprot:UN24063
MKSYIMNQFAMLKKLILEQTRRIKENWLRFGLPLTSICIGACLICYTVFLIKDIYKIQLIGILPDLYPPEDKSSHWNIWDVMKSIDDTFPEYPVVMTIVLISPMAALVILLMTICNPNNLMLRIYHPVNVAYYFFMSFSCLEVFCFAIYANLKELETFSQFLVDKQAPELCKWVEHNVHTSCLSAEGHAREGLYWLP